MKVSAHDESPCVIQASQRIRTRAEPFCNKRCLLCGVSQDLFSPQPALLVRLRRQRTGRVIREFHLAGIAGKMGGLFGRDVEKHLIGFGRDDVNGTVADLYGGPLLMLISAGNKLVRRRQSDIAFRHDRFEALDGIFLGRAADVAGSIIVIVGGEPANLSVVLNPSGPVALIAVEFMFLLAMGQGVLFPAKREEFLNLILIEGLTGLIRLLKCLLQIANLLSQVFKDAVRRFWGEGLAQIRFDAATVAAGIDSCEDAFAIWTDPDADVEGSSFGRALDRLRTSSRCG